VGLLSVAVRPAPAVGRATLRLVRRPELLVIVGYVLAAIAMTWRLWSHPTSMAPTNGYGVSPDIYLNAWFMRYAATAVAHGRLPDLITTAVNYPHGISAMWNTSFLLPSVLLTPVTLLAGPLASLTVVLTLGFAGSAISLFYVLRRWGASLGAAAIGGAIYAFSPAMLVAGEDHYHLQFAVLPPLIVDAALRLLTGRGRPVRTGAWLGALIAAQIFIAEELLVGTALAVLALVIVLAASRRRQIRARLSGAMAGFGTAIGVVVVIAGYALWAQFFGPLNEYGSPWQLSKYGNLPADFVTAPTALAFHGQFGQFMTESGQRMVEYFAYLGWPLLVLLAIIGVVYWRDLRIRLAVTCFALVSLLSVGGHIVTFGGWRVPLMLLPWHWLRHVPVLSQVLPNRLSLLADGAAAAVVAFGIDRARTAVPHLGRPRMPDLSKLRMAGLGKLQMPRFDKPEMLEPDLSTPRSAALANLRMPVIAGIVAIALIPLIPRPIPAGSAVAPPPGWRAVMAGLHLRPGAPVFALPQGGALVMEWQAVTNEPISIVGGYCITAAASRHAAACSTYLTQTEDQQTMRLRINWLAAGMPVSDGPGRDVTSDAMAGWRPDAVIAVTEINSALGRYLVESFGRPTVAYDDVVGWRLRPQPPRSLLAS
jgi:hypothetical protein